MGNSRPTKKVRKIKAKSARRRLTLKNQSFKPIVRAVNVEKLQKEFEAKPVAEKDPTS